MTTNSVVQKPRITLIEGRVMTTSLVVAEHFDKRHDDVLKAIRAVTAEAPEEFHLRNFAEVFRSVPGANGAVRQMPLYRMTRDGFALIAMGFTGKKALAWKVAYIDTFNAMEEALRKLESPSAPLPAMTTTSNADATLFLTLFYALGNDRGAATLMLYLLRKNAHLSPCRSSYRAICEELNGAITVGTVTNASRRLTEIGLLELSHGYMPGGPTNFLVLIEPLMRLLAQMNQRDYPRLVGFVATDPTKLLH